jgi:methionine sulfoxide reductase heme-binding subunit
MMLWDVARASAMVAFVCFTFTVAWGLGLSARFWRPAAEQVGFHRFLSTLGLVAVGTHVASLLADRYAHVTPGSLLGRDPRPGVVVGALALWLAVALPLSFRLRKARWISQRAWRSFHYFGYAVWGLSFVHGVTSGTDTRSPFAVALYAGSAALVGAAAWHRWLEQPRPAAKVQPESPAR